MSEQAKAKLVSQVLVDLGIILLCVAFLGPLGLIPAFLLIGAMHRKG